MTALSADEPYVHGADFEREIERIARDALAASQETKEQYPEDGRTRSDYEAFGG